ncbi:MAG: DUF493 domain-containing protein [Porticoccaceae bacterium]|jgi:putative lipoic acid-binding regulatory protein
MTEPQAPKIEFPCSYPVKVMGHACDEFRDHVHQVMDLHAPGYDRAAVTVRDSRNGRFQSVTVVITATSVTQLEAIFTDLKVSKHVQMVL